jgi:hypothetical protein
MAENGLVNSIAGDTKETVSSPALHSYYVLLT